MSILFNYVDFRILSSTMNEGHKVVGAGLFGAYWVFNALLCILFVLNCMWFYMILRMVYYYMITGQVCNNQKSLASYVRL